MKLIKSVAVIIGAGAIALASGFVVGVTTNLIKQARAAKAEHKLRQYIAEPFEKLAGLYDSVAKGYATTMDLDIQHGVAMERIGQLAEGPYKALMQTELFKTSLAIESVKAAVVAAKTTTQTQEEPSHA